MFSILVGIVTGNFSHLRVSASSVLHTFYSAGSHAAFNLETAMYAYSYNTHSFGIV